jgi:mRNA interferase RelE/StbE
VKTEFKKSFEKDLKKIKDKNLLNWVKEIIEEIEQAHSIAELNNVKKLRESGKYYRIKVGDYRIGFLLEKDIVVFVRFLHRKDIYRYFP